MHVGRLTILLVAILGLGIGGGTQGCMRAQDVLQFPMDEITSTRQEVEALGSDVRQGLAQVEYEMSQAFGDIPPDAFEPTSLYAIRYALMWCFTAPICDPGSQSPVCKRRQEQRDTRIEERVELSGRPPVYGYTACDLPYSSSLLEAVETWSPESLEWFQDRVLLIDGLRIRLKAQIPERLDELDVQVHRYRTELQQLNKRAQDRWREAQRIEKRADQRRSDEEKWTRFREEAMRLEESVTLIGLDLNRLRDHQRHDVRDIAVRLATLGAEGF